MSDALWMYTIYDHPSDYPNLFMARRWKVTGGAATGQGIVAWGTTLEQCRAGLPPGLHRLRREPADDPVIVETWL